MRAKRFVFALFVSACAGWAAPLPAGEQGLRRADAERQLEIAELQLGQYDRVEFPQALQQIDHQIVLAEAELAIQQRRIAEVGPQSPFKYSGAFLTTLQSAQRSALQAELRIDELNSARRALQQNRADHRRLLQLQRDAAADRVQQISAER
ncbi:MAG TPA: hypothetical protein VFE24_10920 [Pirellulales bacterium]|jgi:hypothetical protein|nr:hypothetical protein [Pirellulales bacterium]